MKTKLLILAALLGAGACAQAQNNDYELRTLTFEDKDYKGNGSMQSTNQANWSSLIDNPQYGGKLLYGESGKGSDKSYYYWCDENNTMIAHEFPLNWGKYCYWGGGHAISNYVSSDITAHGDFNSQLTVFKEGIGDLTRTGGGNEGSDNFCVHFGYTDNSGYSAKNLPEFYFVDGTARVIDHMWVNNMCYNLNTYMDGNGLTAKIGEKDWVKIVATGYDAKGDEVSTKAELYLCQGPKNIVKEWTKFDLSVLGAVTKIAFNVTGSSDNGYGFSQPAYFAYDDVAVRFPKATTGINATTTVKTVDNVKYVNLQGCTSNEPFDGVNIKVTTYSDGSVKTIKLVK